MKELLDLKFYLTDTICLF